MRMWFVSREFTNSPLNYFDFNKTVRSHYTFKSSVKDSDLKKALGSFMVSLKK